MNAARAKYSAPAIALHWLLALLIIGQIALGLSMLEIPRNTPERAYFFNLHKSLGLLAAGFIALRIVWRWRHSPPPLPASMPAWQVAAAHWGHRLLYACMVLMPLSGYLSSSFGKFGVKFFGLPLPNWGWEDAALRELFSGAHAVVAWIFVALILGHIAAALKHLVVDGDDVFYRMLP